jgi:hypothetical protein
MMTFETENCGRCGGSGHYSYCSQYGTICFKCKGRKVAFTKRGARANSLYASFLTKSLDNLRVGDLIWENDFFKGSSWMKVESIHPDALNPGLTTVQTDKMGLGVHSTHRFRVKALPSQREGLLLIALAYQEVLNKTGKEPAWLKTIAWG